MKNRKFTLYSVLKHKMTMISVSILLSSISTLPFSSMAQTISPCDAFITYTISTQNPLEVTFCNASEYANGAFGFNFQWDLGDGFTSYDSCVTHVYSVPGVYTICFWVSACDPNIGGVSCGDDTCITISVGGKATSVIEDALSNNSLSAFPNPFDQQVDITLLADDLIASVEILSITGNRILLQQTYGRQDFRIDGKSFPADGNYLLRITTLKGKMLSVLLSRIGSD